MPQTEPHDSTTCAAGADGQKCEMCQFAQNASQTNSSLFRAEQGQEIDSSPSLTPGMTLCRDCQGLGQGDGLDNICPYCHGSGQVETYAARQGRLVEPVLSDFEQEWRRAPKWATRTTERDCAEWWLLRGVLIGQHKQAVEDSRVFRAMAERRGLTQ